MMDLTEDYYATLRVSPGAENADVRAAYRALMRRYHPDVNASVEALREATAINEAYACLRDPSQRATYDRLREVRSRNPRAPRAPARARPQWTHQEVAPVRSTASFRPTWWKVAGLGMATLVTAITFTLTSATPPAGAVTAEASGEAQANSAAPPATRSGKAPGAVSFRSSNKAGARSRHADVN